jgi:hypothetical protein
MRKNRKKFVFKKESSAHIARQFHIALLSLVDAMQRELASFRRYKERLDVLLMYQYVNEGTTWGLEQSTKLLDVTKQLTDLDRRVALERAGLETPGMKLDCVMMRKMLNSYSDSCRVIGEDMTEMRNQFTELVKSSGLNLG